MELSSELRTWLKGQGIGEHDLGVLAALARAPETDRPELPATVRDFFLRISDDLSVSIPGLSPDQAAQLRALKRTVLDSTQLVARRFADDASGYGGTNIPGTGDVFQALEMLFGASSSPTKDEERWLVRTHAAKLLPLMPGAGPLFSRFPERLALLSLAHGLANTATLPGLGPKELNLFFVFLTYKNLISGKLARGAFAGGVAMAHLSSLYKEFLHFQYYLFFALQASMKLGEYSERTAVNPLSLMGDHLAIANSQFLVYYLARRADFKEESWPESLQAAIEQMRDEGIIEIPSPQALEDLFDHFLRQFDFLARVVAAEAEIFSRFSGQINQDLPDAAHYAEGKEQTVSWEEVERLRRANLPASSTGEKPTVMIAGVGCELELVERYAALGYNLILVDPLESVGNYFRKNLSKVRDLERRSGVRIQFVAEDIRSGELARFYAGKIDVLEYHNCFEFFQEDTDAIHRMLRPGGLFLQFHPFPINRDILVEQGYAVLLSRENIPCTLGTFCERNAYPLGDHVLMLKSTSGLGKALTPVVPARKSHGLSDHKPETGASSLGTMPLVMRRWPRVALEPSLVTGASLMVGEDEGGGQRSSPAGLSRRRPPTPAPAIISLRSPVARSLVRAVARF